MHPTQRTLLAGAMIGMASLSLGCGMLANSNNVQGKRLYQSGQFDQAVTSFQQALQRDPRNADACYNLATTYHHLGMATKDTAMITQAEAYYNESLNRDPNHTDAHRGLAVLLVQDDRKDSAFTLLRRWSAANPLSPEPKIELARLYREFGDNQTAAELLAEALKQDPRSVRANRAIGQIREDQGEISLALDSYNRAWTANNMQPDLAPRIAALQQQIATGSALSANGTRMAQAPAATGTTAPQISAQPVPVNSAGRY